MPIRAPPWISPGLSATTISLSLMHLPLLGRRPPQMVGQTSLHCLRHACLMPRHHNHPRPIQPRIQAQNPAFLRLTNQAWGQARPRLITRARRRRPSLSVPRLLRIPLVAQPTSQAQSPALLRQTNPAWGPARPRLITQAHRRRPRQSVSRLRRIPRTTQLTSRQMYQRLSLAELLPLHPLARVIAKTGLQLLL